ncbi:hypothetical protein [Novosphingobium sp. Leaf2]|uniref:hypothetical protein n=1 Tax=Novosphingobium sp. Leaf2 TaxID=1735670 RepID=UPI0006F20582|nr:hypothetical protein [Novosphingobium sp. Leaf2]KQM18379.1 hypothetical protein ASE49_09215 [Novosphingobium sp. Leaf2]
MDQRIRIVPAEWRHINTVANRLRDIDRRECEAMGRSGKDALRHGVVTSDKAWTALVDGRPEAVFGVVVESLIDRVGTPWFLGTDEVYRHGKALLMWGPGILARMGDSSLRLCNLVSADNRRAIRLLERWGFTVAKEHVVVRGVPFRHFERIG